MRRDGAATGHSPQPLVCDGTCAGGGVRPGQAQSAAPPACCTSVSGSVPARRVRSLDFSVEDAAWWCAAAAPFVACSCSKLVVWAFIRYTKKISESSNTDNYKFRYYITQTVTRCLLKFDFVLSHLPKINKACNFDRVSATYFNAINKQQSLNHLMPSYQHLHYNGPLLCFHIRHIKGNLPCRQFI
jgi:hypothetical protein